MGGLEVPLECLLQQHVRREPGAPGRLFVGAQPAGLHSDKSRSVPCAPAPQTPVRRRCFRDCRGDQIGVPGRSEARREPVRLRPRPGSPRPARAGHPSTPTPAAAVPVLPLDVALEDHGRPRREQVVQRRWTTPAPSTPRLSPVHALWGVDADEPDTLPSATIVSPSTTRSTVAAAPRGEGEGLDQDLDAAGWEARDSTARGSAVEPAPQPKTASATARSSTRWARGALSADSRPARSGVGAPTA